MVTQIVPQNMVSLKLSIENELSGGELYENQIKDFDLV